MEYLYACHFSNGHIKVGRSISPIACIEAHTDRVACLGVTLERHHMAMCVGNVIACEAALIARCAQFADGQHKNEWFAGLVFSTVRQWVDECAGLIHDVLRQHALKTFWFGMPVEKRKEFALACKTWVGHLTNACYGYTTLNPALCVLVERESGGQVTRQDLRDDWQAIWPELALTSKAS